jgi:hypothetical protein
MASILEREAMVKSEKPVMASVFYNRMKKGMTLSSDATVNFVFDYAKKRIYYKDLKVDSPYNTYKYKGYLQHLSVIQLLILLKQHIIQQALTIYFLWLKEMEVTFLVEHIESI